MIMSPPPPIFFPVTPVTQAPAQQERGTVKSTPPVFYFHTLKSAQDIPALKPADVLVFLAHPDDDNICAGALLALRNKNYSVQLVYATTGENGRDVNGQVPKGPLLANARKKELISALQQLKIDREPVVLDVPDGKTSEAINVQKLSNAFSAVIRQVKPRLIITFGADGLDGHPDHRQVGHIADNVVRAYEAGMPHPPRLLHMALSRDEAQALKEMMNAPGLEYWQAVRSANANGPGKSSEAGELIHQNISAFVPEVVASLCMYRTQFSTEEILRFVAFYQRMPWESFIEIKNLPDQKTVDLKPTLP